MSSLLNWKARWPEGGDGAGARGKGGRREGKGVGLKGVGWLGGRVFLAWGQSQAANEVDGNVMQTCFQGLLETLLSWGRSGWIGADPFHDLSLHSYFKIKKRLRSAPKHSFTEFLPELLSAITEIDPGVPQNIARWIFYCRPIRKRRS